MSAREYRKPVPLSGLPEIVGRDLPWLHRHIRELREKHGFPKPLPVIGKYDPVAVEDWVMRWRNGNQVAAVAASPGVVDWSATLAERARKLAKEKRA